MVTLQTKEIGEISGINRTNFTLNDFRNIFLNINFLVCFTKTFPDGRHFLIQPLDVCSYHFNFAVDGIDTLGKEPGL